MVAPILIKLAAKKTKSLKREVEESRDTGEDFLTVHQRAKAKKEIDHIKEDIEKTKKDLDKAKREGNEKDWYEKTRELRQLEAELEEHFRFVGQYEVANSVLRVA